MEAQIIEILACPACGNGLVLREEETIGNAMISGKLYCVNCRAFYEIVDGIPYFLNSGTIPQDDREKIAAARSQTSIREFEEKLVAWERKLPATLMSGLRKGYETTINWATPSRGTYILDWATGRGHLFRRMVETLPEGKILIGLDIDAEVLAKLRGYLRKKGTEKKTSFIVCNASRLPFKGDMFSAVTANAGLIEIAHPEKAIEETMRVLKKGGRFAASGQIYEEGSRSYETATDWGIGTFALQGKAENYLRKIGFSNVKTETYYQDVQEQGGENDLLPHPGDWYAEYAVFGRKPCRGK
jgi:ubiquinone/menaquinone biosynthesis C-methylase UbiE/uncharacterized protein YbaR (Trm112 family)